MTNCEIFHVCRFQRFLITKICCFLWHVEPHKKIIVFPIVFSDLLYTH